MTRLPLKACAAALTAFMTLGVVVRTPASEAQSVSNFAADVDTAINRGLDYLDRFGAFTMYPDGSAWAGPAAGLVSLALLEKRVDASATAVSQGYARATPADKLKIDRLVRAMVLTQNQAFEAYQNGSELMGLSLYVRTGGLQSVAPDAGTAALGALDRAVDESLDPIDFSFNPPRLVATGEPWTGYWTYHVAGGYDASGTQFVIAGLSAARGAYMQADRGGRLAKINQALAFTRQVYAPTVDPFYDHGLVGQACAPGGILSASERGKGYGLPWVICDPGPILQGVSNSSQQTASGLWIQLVGGSNLNSPGIQAYLEWLRNRYQHSTLQGQAFTSESYGYYLWTATKAFAFLDRSAAAPNLGNLSTADLGVLTPGTGSVWTGAQLRYDPATVARPATFGPGAPGYYADAREPSRWYFDFAYDVMSRQCFGGQPAGLTVPPSNAGWEGIPANPCPSGGSDGYFVPVNGRWPGWEKNVAEQVFHILVLQRALGGSCIDTDNDGLCDTEDNCAAAVNEDQADGDGDGLGDVCDNCQFYNPDQLDSDNNGLGDACATPPTVDANDDSGSTTTAGGVAVLTVLTNDTVNDIAALPTAVNTAFVSSTHPNVGLSGNSVIVAADTPIGVYTLIYRICEVLNPANCDGATVTVTVTDGQGAVIDAVNDVAPVSDGSTGNANVLDVIADNGNGPDTLDGVPGDAGTVTVTSFTSDHAGVTLSGSILQVAPGTPTGTYNLHYRLCVAVALTPCDEADVTVPVVMPGIDAIDDEGVAVSGAGGGVSFPNVLINDTLGPIPAATVAGQIDTSEISSTDPGVFLDGLSVVVAPGTPPGDHILEYEICESVSMGANCDTAIVTVPVKMAILVANDDTGVTVNGMTGGTSFTNILVNDTEDGQAATPANLDIVQVSSANTGVSLNGVDVVVAPNTQAGSYELVYEICVSASAGGSCDEATVFVTVSWAPIDAVNDAGAPVIGISGGESLANVTVNDTLSGTPVDLSAVILSYVSGSAGLSLNTATGAVLVAPGTPVSPVGAPYTLTYRLCERLNPTNCDTAVVTVPVVSAPIDAVNDIGNSVNGTGGGLALLSVLSNDTLNGVSVGLPSVNLTYIGGTAGLTLDSGTGSVWVWAGTPATPAATLTYQICERANPTNCDTAVVTVAVFAGAIDAWDDNGAGVNGAAGGLALPNVLVNDVLNGAAATLANVTLSFVNGTAGLSLNTATGAVTVAAGTAANPAATLTYQICEVLNPGNCDTATVTVPILAAVIDAVNDAGASIVGAVGGQALATVLTNDTLNSAAATTANVVISFVNGTAGLTLNAATGAVNVTAGTAANPAATLTYQICEVLNPGNCDTATVTVPILAAAIDAVNDAGASTNGASGGLALATVLTNDTLNGVAATEATVTIAFVSGPAGLSLNPVTGAVTVAPGTAASPVGSPYQLTYRICETLNPGNCDQAVVTVPVVAAAIDAVNDSGTVNSLTGGTAVANVLGNDTLNNILAALGLVTTTQVSTSNPGVTLTGTGVTVTAGTPAGVYTLTYSICETLNPSNCDQAIVTVTVNAPAIDAVDDSGNANGETGGTAVADVIGNDTLNGTPVSSTAITVSQVSTSHTGVTLSGRSVVVAAGTPPDTYTLVYSICEVVNPTNCDTATVTVTVTVPNKVPTAVDDSATTNEDTAVTDTAATNDALGDGSHTWTLVGANGGAAHGTVTMTPTGSYTYTPAANYNGVDVFSYQVCDRDNDCSQARVTVTINAVDDMPAAATDTNTTRAGVAVSASAAGNDTQSGDGGNVWTLVGTNGGTTHATVTMTAAGVYTYTPNAGFVGVDTFTYRLCDADGDCATTTVTIDVTNRPPVAVNDTATTSGSPVTISVLGNDSDPDGDTLTITSNTTPPATSGTLVRNANGTFTFTPVSGFTGTVTFTYTISDGKGGTATATVTITVTGSTTGNCGCSPGYWKNHASNWGPSGYAPTHIIKNVFSGAAGYGSIGTSTLLAGLNFGGSGAYGSAQILLRQGIAALLNAAHPGVDYPRTVASVIADVNTALLSGNSSTMLTLASQLDRDNNLGCPLGNGSDDKSSDDPSSDDRSGDHSSGGNHNDGCKGQKGHGHHDHDGCPSGSHGGDGKSDDSSEDHGSDDSSGGNHNDNCKGNKGHGHHESDGCPTGTHKKRMTGGGSVFTSAKDRVTHGMELHCDINARPNNLEVNWGNGEKFKLSSLTTVRCTDDPSIGPRRPIAGFDTMVGTGTGSYSGKSGATVSFTFTDAGEPGRSDVASITVKDAAGRTVLTVNGTVSNGNQQAHGG